MTGKIGMKEICEFFRNHLTSTPGKFIFILLKRAKNNASPAVLCMSAGKGVKDV
jgi:hypothetical protein